MGAPSYLTEGRAEQMPWVTLGIDRSPEAAARTFANWNAVPGSLELRLVERTVTVTDRVLSRGRQWQHKAEACECYLDCRDCSLSGREWHVHPGQPCYVHPEAPGDR